MTQQKNKNYFHQDMMMSPTTGMVRSSREFFKLLLVIIGGVIICTSPFWCEPFRFQKTDLNELKSSNKKRVEQVKQDIAQLRSVYDSNTIEKEEYIVRLHTFLDDLEVIEKENGDRISKLTASTKVFDWKNTYTFLIALGTRIPVVVYPLVILFLFRIKLFKIEKKYLKISFILFNVMTLGTGLFWMVWVFWPFNDFNFNTYLFAIICICLLSSAMITYFMLWYKLKLTNLSLSLEKLYSISKLAFAFIFKETDKEEFIRQEKKSEYQKRRVELAEKAVSIEQS